MGGTWGNAIVKKLLYSHFDHRMILEGMEKIYYHHKGPGDTGPFVVHL